MGLVSTVLYLRGGISSVDARGSINTTRWSDGLPFTVLGLMGGFVTGSMYHFPSVLIMGSSIASGLSRVATFTNCFIFGERLVIGERFNLLVSPAIIKWMSGPYMDERK